MARIILPAQWTSQPQYGFRINPFWSSFKIRTCLVPFNNTFIDVGPRRAPVTVVSALTNVVGPTGRGQYTSNTGKITIPGLAGTQTFTRLCVMAPATMAAAGCISNSDNVDSSQSAILYTESGGEMVFLKQNVAGVVSTGAAIAVGKLSILGLTYDGADARFFANGRTAGVEPFVQTFTIGSTGQMFHYGNPSFSNQADATFFLYVEFDRVLPPALMLSLTQNPWQIFTQTPHEYWFDHYLTVDVVTESIRTATTDPYTFSHAGGAAPKGVLLFAIHGTSATDHITAVTYGGDTLTCIVTAADSSGEPGRTDIWFAGTSVPTGTQTVSIDLSSATTDDYQFTCVTLNATTDLEAIDFDSIAANQSDPQRTLSFGGRTAMSFCALYSGADATSTQTDLADQTRLSDHDFGTFTGHVSRLTTAQTTDDTIGYTSVTDDVAFAAVAIGEVLPPTEGDLAVSETGSDTAALAGGLRVQGTIAVTEVGASVATISGTVRVQGTLARAETGSDTAALAGVVKVQGALAATESGADVAAASGVVKVTGAMAATESGADTFASTGITAVSVGDLAVTETGTETAALSGTVLSQGALAVTESGADVLAAAGQLRTVGTFSVTEPGSDTFAADGDTPLQGTMSALETGNDTAAMSGVALSQGVMAVSETGSDTAVISGTAPVAGAFAATETGADTAAMQGGAPSLNGAFAAIEIGSDIASLNGATLIQGLLAAAETGFDTSSMSGAILVTGVLSAFEANDDVFFGLGEADSGGGLFSKGPWRPIFMPRRR